MVAQIAVPMWSHSNADLSRFKLRMPHTMFASVTAGSGWPWSLNVFTTFLDFWIVPQILLRRVAF